MDIPFDIARWIPTQPQELGDTPLAPHSFQRLKQCLAIETKHVLHHPYDPQGWIVRAEILRKLKYPELALGDAHKATLLCRQHLRQLDDDAIKREWRLGCGLGFRMREPEGDNDGLRQRLLRLQEQAEWEEETNLCVSGIDERGKFHPRPYPWLTPQRSRRSDELVSELNREFAASAENASGIDDHCCGLRRHALGDTGPKSRDVLGVFATRHIPKGSTILVDKSRIWGCNGPGTTGDLDNLHGGSGCGDPIHPNLPEEDFSLDLRWTIQDGVSNPLDHSLVARLTPTYRYDAEPQSFYRHTDIDIPMRALQQFGIDIFADHNFDTWVLFTVFARAENNSCGCLLSESLMPLFSLFNHSCEPNLEWIRPRGGSRENSDNEEEDENNDQSFFGRQPVEEGIDHSTIIVTTLRDIKKGEQLFVEYDSFVHDDSLWERRSRLKKWLAGNCMCERCVREEKVAEMVSASGPSSRQSSGSEGAASWDDGEKVDLPEDGNVPG